MPVIRMNAVGNIPEFHTRPETSQRIWDDLAQEAGPIIVMIHGYKYQPSSLHHCPHRQILSMSPTQNPLRAPSWPRQLGFGLGHEKEGLALAFGWNARSGFRQAHANTTKAGHALGLALSRLYQQSPARPIHIISHSLGTAVALKALHDLPAGAVQRLISLTGAVYQSDVYAALATPAGRAAEFVNITSRENDAFDFIFERLTSPKASDDFAIGQGIDAPNAVTLQLDCLQTLENLQRLGYQIAAPQRRICHWSSYMRPGALRLYKHLLRRPNHLPLSRLQQLRPQHPAPRWSRMFNLRLQPKVPLPI